MPTNRGRGIKRQLCPFAGIIQIKFERYDLRTSTEKTHKDYSVLEHPPC